MPRPEKNVTEVPLRKRPSTHRNVAFPKRRPVVHPPRTKEEAIKALEKFHPRQFAKGIETGWLKKEANRKHEWGVSDAIKRRTLQRWTDPEKTDLRRYKDTWVRDHATALKVLARHYRIPAEFLASVIWQEIGGDPDSDDRQKIWGLTLPGVRIATEKTGRLRAEKVSYGDTSLQIGHVAEMIGLQKSGVDAKAIKLIAAAMEDEQLAIGLSAAHIAEALDERYPNRKATRFSPGMAAFLGLGYNAGYSRIMKLPPSEFRSFADSLNPKSNADIDVPKKYGPMRELLYDKGKP